MRNLSAAAVALLATLGVAHAQQEVEWKQVLSTPKGASVPRDRADILGIELGDTYAEASAKLRKLFDEGVQKKPSDVQPKPRRSSRMPDDEPEPIVPVKEEKNNFRYQPAGAALIVTASFVGKLVMERNMKAEVAEFPTMETIKVFLSSPASGHQVIGIDRLLTYRTQGAQPRVSEIIDQLIRKMKGQPHIRMQGSHAEYIFQFDKGDIVDGARGVANCHPFHDTTQAALVPTINPTGQCDAMLKLDIMFGVSRDHAQSVRFVLSDNERTKANLSADFAYVQSAIRSMQERTRGAAPKL